MFPSRLVSVLRKVGVDNNYSLDFDGSDDYVIVPHASNLNIGTSDVTVSAWVKLNSVSGDRRITYKHSQPSMALNGASMYLAVPYVSSATADSGTTLAVNQWYHLAIVYNQSADTVTYYVNGSLSSSKSYSGAPDNSQTSALWIGAGDNGAGSPEKAMDGIVDELAIWDTALSAGDISAMYSARGTADLNDDGNSANLISWWRFEEGSGTSAIDSSANSNTGTLTNGPTYSTDVPS